MASKNGLVLVGNNEDRKFLKTTVSFLPATERSYGSIVFGFTDAPGQGGMNDQGLTIDGNRVSPTGWTAEEGKPFFRGFVIMQILATCATVKDAKAFFEKYNVPALERARFPIADRTGASMVVEFAQGRVQFVETEEWYQISTNFIMSNVRNREYPCWRYETAERLFKKANHLDVDLIRDILDSTQQRGNSLTVYSSLYDLRGDIIYVYNRSDFNNPIVLNLADELKAGRRTLNLPELFKKNL